MRSSSSWKSKTIESFTYEVRRNIGGYEVVYIVALTAVFLFVSIWTHSRQAATYIDLNGIRWPTVTIYYGAPFEMLSFWWYLPDFTSSMGGTLVVLWTGFLIDAAIFSVSAFFIVFAVTKVKNDRERARYYSQK